MSEIDENKNTFFCRKCGSKVAEDHCFCEKCGAKIVRENDAKVTAIPQNIVHNNVQNETVSAAEPGDSVNCSTEPVTNTTDSNAQNVTVNNSDNSDSSTNVEYSQNFVQVNPKKKPAPIKIVITSVILCVLVVALIVCFTGNLFGGSVVVYDENSEFDSRYKYTPEEYLNAVYNIADAYYPETLSSIKSSFGDELASKALECVNLDSADDFKNEICDFSNWKLYDDGDYYYNVWYDGDIIYRITMLTADSNGKKYLRGLTVYTPGDSDEETVIGDFCTRFIAPVLIAPLIDANPVVSNRLVGKCKNSNETTYVFNENGIRYYYNSHIFGIMALSDDYKDATFDRIHLSESDLQ